MQRDPIKKPPRLAAGSLAHFACVITDNTSLSFYANANCYWLKNENIDRPAYMVAKKNLESEMLALPKFTKLYEQNGYCFFVRMPQNKP